MDSEQWFGGKPLFKEGGQGAHGLWPREALGRANSAGSEYKKENTLQWKGMNQSEDKYFFFFFLGKSSSDSSVVHLPSLDFPDPCLYL
jgi:hypothetical protein